MDPFKFYYARAIKYLARRPRSEKEVRDNLLKKKVPPEVLEKIIEILTKQKFLSDFEFARWWIDQRSQFRPRSMRLLKLELRQKGVSSEIIESGIRNHESRENDMATARKIVEKRFPKMKGWPKEEIYKKLGGYLARRGYNWDIIKSSIDEAIGKKV